MPSLPDPATVEIARLQGVTLFAGLAAATLREIAEAAAIRHYPPDTHVLLQGDDCQAAYFLLEGEARVYRVSEEGREQVLVRLVSGQSFNTVPVFQRAATNPANVVTLTDVSLCVVARGAFLQLVQSHADLAMAVINDFAGRLAHLTDLVESLSLHSVEQRLARFLLDRATDPSGARGNADPAGGETTVHRWTQQEIAVHLGTVRDVVGRELRAMEEAKILRIERGRIVLLRREGLEALARR